MLLNLDFRNSNSHLSGNSHKADEFINCLTYLLFAYQRGMPKSSNVVFKDEINKSETSAYGALQGIILYF